MKWSNRANKDKKFFSLDAWNPATEAKAFRLLVFLNLCTYRQAIKDITMTSKQRDWLSRNGIVSKQMANKLYTMRLQTLRLFKEMVREPKTAMELAQEAEEGEVGRN